MGVRSKKSLSSKCSEREEVIITLYLGTLLPLHSHHEFTTVKERAYEV